MVSFPIALGGVTVSSQLLDAPRGRLEEEVDDDGDYNDIDNDEGRSNEKNASTIEPQLLGPPSIAMAVCPHREWQARVVTAFYGAIPSNSASTKPARLVVRKGSNNVRAEVRVQIGYLASPLSPRYRETVHYVRLLRDGGIASQSEDIYNRNNKNNDDVDDDDDENDSGPIAHSNQQRQPQVVFSQDRRNLAVLLFPPASHLPVQHPPYPFNSSQSQLVIFQLRRPRTDVWAESVRGIPIPPYITEHNTINKSNGRVYNTGNNNGTSNSSSSLLSADAVGNDRQRQSIGTPSVATNPRLFVSLWGITTLCRIPVIPRSGRPILLAACQDGTLVWIDNRSVETLATGTLKFKSTTSTASSSPSSSNSVHITSMQAGPSSTMERGTLVLVTAVKKGTSYGGSNSSGGECLLVEWSLQSTTPIQQTILKRASTGSLSVTEIHRTRSLDDLQLLEQESSSSPSSFHYRNGDKVRVTPRRTSSMGSVLGLQRTFQSVMDLASTSRSPVPKSLLRGRRNKVGEQQSPKHNDKQQQQPHSFFRSPRNNLFRANGIDTSNNTKQIANSEGRLLQGFKVPPFNFMEGTSSQSNGSPRVRSHSTGEDTHHLKKGDDARIEYGSPRQSRFPRRRSDPNMHNGQDTTTRNMRVDILSHWSGHNNNNTDDEVAGGQDQPDKHGRQHHPKVVIDACFGSLSSVVCVMYNTTTSQLSTSAERRQRIAQVLTITEAGTLKSFVSLFVTLEQIEQATSVTTLDDDNNINNHIDDENVHTDYLKDDNDCYHRNVFRSTQSQFGLEHDDVTDNFVISSTFGTNKYWIGCVWNWRVNAIGYMIQHEVSASLPHPLLWSRLYYSQDPYRGSYLVYIAASIFGANKELPQQKNIQLRKQSVMNGFLSPSSSLSSGIYEPCSLLLANDYVSFPWVSKKANGSDTLELGWMTSALPQSYVATFGSPRIAAVGHSHTKSVAVASSKGVCVLDAHNIHRHRWKQFGSPNQEKMFSVAAMTWWEGHSGAKNEAKRDDFLITITETNSGRQYLSCWSPKRYVYACYFY
jgi:hypothetical protein